MKFLNNDILYDNKFLGSNKDYDNSDIVILGVPMDYTSSYRAGSRFAPDKIREVSIGIEEYSPYLNKDLCECKYIDIGNLDLPIGDVETSLNLIEDLTDSILDTNKKPIIIGGEHLITFPIIKSFYKRYMDEFYIIHIDAHADLRKDYLGVKLSHATVIRRCIDYVRARNVFQFGIRSGTKEEFDYAAKFTNFYPFNCLKNLKDNLETLKKKKVYITLDIDVVDPAYACGTGTPEPGGITSQEMIEVISSLKDLDIIGFDIVEVSPIYDIADITSFLAAKLIRDIILIMSKE